MYNRKQTKGVLFNPEDYTGALKAPYRYHTGSRYRMLYRMLKGDHRLFPLFVKDTMRERYHLSSRRRDGGQAIVIPLEMWLFLIFKTADFGVWSGMA